MRFLIVCALCVFAAPAAAQRVEVQTINGVRVMSPRAQPPAPTAESSGAELQPAAANAEPVDVSTINGVRVWRPRPLPPEPVIIVLPEPQHAITPLLAEELDPWEGWPFYDAPFLGAVPFYQMDRSIRDPFHRHALRSKPFVTRPAHRIRGELSRPMRMPRLHLRSLPLRR